MSSIYGADDSTSPNAIQSRWQNLFLRGATGSAPIIGPFTMTFDELGITPASGISVENLYSGTGAGPNYGVTIAGAKILGENDPGSTFNFEPSPLNGITFLDATGIFIFNAAGALNFISGASINFCTRLSTATFEAWSGLNRTGVLLVSQPLPATGTNGPGRAFSAWDVAGMIWAGNAKSLAVVGTFNFAIFDSISAVTA